jgi:hypothetical protein
LQERIFDKYFYKYEKIIQLKHYLSIRARRLKQMKFDDDDSDGGMKDLRRFGECEERL